MPPPRRAARSATPDDLRNAMGIRKRGRLCSKYRTCPGGPGSVAISGGVGVPRYFYSRVRVASSSASPGSKRDPRAIRDLGGGPRAGRVDVRAAVCAQADRHRPAVQRGSAGRSRLEPTQRPRGPASLSPWRVGASAAPPRFSSRARARARSFSFGYWGSEKRDPFDARASGGRGGLGASAVRATILKGIGEPLTSPYICSLWSVVHAAAGRGARRTLLGDGRRRRIRVGLLRRATRPSTRPRSVPSRSTAPTAPPPADDAT
jgi:hypothetical protein